MKDNSMKIKSSNTEPPFLIIQDLYNEDELCTIKKEIDFIHSSGYLGSDVSKTSSAKTADGVYLKKAKGVWIDSLYTNRDTSMILKLNRILMTNPEIAESFINLNQYYNSYRAVNVYTSLLNYYENEGYYDTHKDAAAYSTITWFFNKPKKFKGGNLIFTDLNFEVEIEDNMSIIFPSWMKHKVEEVKMVDANTDDKNGRYSLAQFLFIAPQSLIHGR